MKSRKFWTIGGGASAGGAPTWIRHCTPHSMALCNPGYISPDGVVAVTGHFKMVQRAPDPWLNQRTTCE